MSKAGAEYGGALFELAVEEGLTERLTPEVEEVARILSENPGYVRLLACPTVPVGERLAALREAFEGKIHARLLSFLLLMTENRRAAYLPDALIEYRRLFREYAGIATGRAESAVPLTDGQKERLTAALSRRIGKRVELTYTVDPALLGGVRVTVDGRLFDGTVSEKLAGIREEFSALTL